MKNFFEIKLNLSSGANQEEIMQFLKSNGSEVIQTSDGLCVKTEKSQADLQSSWADKKWDLIPTGVDAKDSALSPDVQAFLNS